MSIPHCFHFIWYQGTKKIPGKYLDNLTCFEENHKEWEFNYWDEDRILTLMKQHYPEYYDLFQSYPEMIQKIDVAKYFILDHYGGVYCDLDAKCIKNIDDLIDSQELLLSQMNLSGMQMLLFYMIKTHKYYVNNHFIASKPHHKFWPIIFKRLEAALRNSYTVSRGVYVIQSTGPLLISSAIEELDKDSYTIMDCTYLDPINCFTRRNYTNKNTHIVHSSDSNWVTSGSKMIVTGMGWIETYGYVILALIVLLLICWLFYME